MRSTINLMNIKPVPTGDSGQGVPLPVTPSRSFRIPAIHIAGGGNSGRQNPTGSPDVGVRSGFEQRLRRIDLWAAGENARPSGRPHRYMQR